jgi:putative hemolysin
MSEESISQIIILSLLLLCSAFFSGSETAFFSLSRLEQDSLKKRSSSLLKKILVRITSAPDALLITILTGNMLVNVFASTLAEILGDRFFSHESELLSIISMTLIILLFGEMTPKNLAVRNSPAFARFSALPIYCLHILFAPVRWVFHGISDWIISFIPGEVSQIKEKKDTLILSAVQQGFRRGILNSSELSLFESFFSFKEKLASDVMVPRTALKGVNINSTTGDLLQGLTGGQVPLIGSYIIGYEKDMDHLEGYIDMKDLLNFKYGSEKQAGLKEIVKPLYTIPESKDLPELMTEMRNMNAEIAQVVDEYGGTAGIITFQIMVESLLGHFYPAEEGSIKEIEPHRYIIPADMEIEALARLFDIELQADVRTVAGLIFLELGDIPEEGTRIEYGKLEFTIRSIARNKILKVEVKLKG